MKVTLGENGLRVDVGTSFDRCPSCGAQRFRDGDLMRCINCDVPRPIQRPLFEDSDWRKKFEEWVHTPEGGQVMNLFIRLAWGVHQRGKRIGAKAIAERIRWHFFVTKAPGESFKVNNNYVAFMARFAEEREPRLVGMFDKREVKT